MARKENARDSAFLKAGKKFSVDEWNQSLAAGTSG